MFVAVDPTTGREVRRVPMDDPATVARKLEAAHHAAAAWRDTSFADRGAVLRAVAQRLRADDGTLAHLMTEEMGKPVREAEGEVAKAAWAAEHFAEHAEGYLADQVIASDATDSRVVYRPLGPVLGILPWNAPFWLASRVFSPALMAGNPVLFKHDPHLPGCAAALATLFDGVGAPDGLVDSVYVDAEGIRSLIEDDRVRAVSLTGSTRAGAAVGRVAGGAIKPMVLELGGSDPAIVCADADLDAAVDAIVIMRMLNAGQSCIAAKRLLVVDEVHDAFVAALEAKLGGLVMGDPRERATDIGPIARADLRDDLHRQVRQTIEAGATCRLGGELPDGPGFFYPPTLLTDVTPDMVACREETFGPVAVVHRVRDEAEAVRVANDTPYGLAASVWSRDVSRATDIAARLDVGQVAINGVVKTDPRLPSGGVKRSGVGRELGPHGIHAFVNAQQVWTGPRVG